MTLSNKAYDRLKWIAMYFLPALATLWLTLSKVWSLPYGSEIGATISAIDLFLAAVLGISKSSYKGDGTLIVDTENEEKDVYTLELNADPSELAEKKTISFVVNAKGSKEVE